MTRRVADLLAEGLVALGVQRVWGEAIPGLPTDDGMAHLRPRLIAVEDPELSVLIADADGRLGLGDPSPRLGAALVPGGILHLSTKPAGLAAPLSVRTAEELVDALAAAGQSLVPDTMAIHLDLDLEDPIADDLVARIDRPDGIVTTLNPSFADADVVVVVGPGVVRGGFTEGLRELARRTGWPVVNTWGAKGVFSWFDPHHGGTAGLQERDFELAGLAGADLVVVSGLDPDESLIDALGSHVVLEVEPWQLAALTYQWEPYRGDPPERLPLYAELSKVITPLYERDGLPLSPARAALHLSGARPEGGLVVADAGVAGFWLARTFPTTEVGSVVVPATAISGFAAAAALIAGITERPCIAVLDELDPVSEAILELAESYGVATAAQVWSEAGELADVDAHARLSESQFAGRSGIVDVPVAVGDEDALLDVAGPVVAWTTPTA